MNFIDIEIEKNIGESAKAFSTFQEEVNLKLLKMAKEANKAFQDQQLEVEQKIEEMKSETNRDETLQTMVIKQIREDEKEDEDKKKYERKINELMEDFSYLKGSSGDSELLALSHTESFKKIQTEDPIYKQWQRKEQKIGGQTKKIEQTRQDQLDDSGYLDSERLMDRSDSLREEQSFEKLAQSQNTKQILVKPKQENKFLFGKVKLMSNYHDETSGIPEYLKYSPQDRVKRTILRIGVSISFIIILAIAYLYFIQQQ